MEKKKLISISLINALSVFIYVTGVSLIIRNGEKIFGQMQSFWGPVAFLLLFVLSATVCGALVLGKPILLYLDGMKQDAVKMFGYTVGWLLGITAIVFMMMISIK
jgi:hypothetical protein